MIPPDGNFMVILPKHHFFHDCDLSIILQFCDFSMILQNRQFVNDSTKRNIFRRLYQITCVTKRAICQWLSHEFLTSLVRHALSLSHISPLVHFLAQHATADSEGDPCPAPSSLDMEIRLLLSNWSWRRGSLAGHRRSCHSTIRSSLPANQISSGDNILFQPRQISWCWCRKTDSAWRSFVGAWLPDAFPFWMHKQH